MNPVVSKRWLLARLYEPDLVIADCRFDLANPLAGRQAYAASRIPGARYFDLEADLSAPVEQHGGRHPLPSPEALIATFSQAGISTDTRVVAYDDQGGAMATRLWWLLHYMGHDRVYVLDGGLAGWKQEGFPIEEGNPAVVIPARFEGNPQPEWLASMPEVQAAAAQALAGEQTETVLLDSREHKRFLGEEEPIDPVAGHIPGALHYFWKDNLNERGQWRSVQELEDRFHALPKDREIIVYCGSGVTACPNVLALKQAGFERVRLYAGSWSDWISCPGNPIATGEE
ncbi:sulfurtransferase [Xylanibacillus composti]|uniref:Thiosulfate sulfurtransferase n=1 Tax=Xylanibacillus composti TaxID=1572762 RepID=A0A8J4H3E7_9BACL|nr:sulfurtransferase [Xylanibacillus composti]MDT9724578.1 sulfurtransferase [Xylanibacillus composti]GIQ70262.1 thiosulfate sulfurtransferase [Xylanibacillus composti]